MRDLKFRAWWKDTKEPVPDFMEEYLMDTLNNDDDNPFVWHQFTGLQDKHGKDIFEGDVVELTNDNDCCTLSGTKTKHLVSFMAPCFVLLEEVNGKGLGHFMWQNNILEIIGNVFENPELMEG